MNRDERIRRGAEEISTGPEWDTDRFGDKWVYGRFTSKLTGSREIIATVLDAAAPDLDALDACHRALADAMDIIRSRGLSDQMHDYDAAERALDAVRAAREGMA